MSRPLTLDRSSGLAMRCPVCERCEEQLDKHGMPTGRCIYSGPYAGYVRCVDGKPVENVP